jgi:hypothetical protein
VVGKYLVSPLTHATDGGRYRASVSIRSGRGSMTHDRVLRLLPVFSSSEDAAQYATAQGLAWIDMSQSPAAAGTTQEPTAWPRKN